jgi:hypothetical protein
MNFGDSFGILWRRKGLTLALLIATLLGAVCAFVILPSKYNASITQTLLNSKGSSETLGGGNPYLSFDSAMVDMANLLAMELTSDANTNTLQQNGYTAPFQAQVLSENPETEEPFIQISVEGGNKVNVARTLQGATNSLGTLLTQVQTGVPAKSRLSLQTIAEVSTPVPSLGAKIKPVVGLLAVGLLLTFLIPQAVEGSARRRKIQGEATAAVQDGPGPRDLDQSAAFDRSSSSHAVDTRAETFQQHRPGQQAENLLRGQRVSHERQKGGVQSRPEYGVPGSDNRPYPQTERRW